MKKITSKSELSKSEKYFVNDLYEVIVSSAHDPIEMMESLSVTLREFIGANEILLFQCSDINGNHLKLLSDIKVNKTDLNNYMILAQEIRNFNHNEIAHYNLSHNTIGPLITAVGEQDVLQIPLNGNDEHIGCMHVYGIGEGEIINQVIRLIDSIRPLLGVVLQNYLLYNDMELMLNERSKGLIEARESLESLIHTVPDMILLTNKRLKVISVYNQLPAKYYSKDIKPNDHLSKHLDMDIYNNKMSYIFNLKDGKTALFTEKIENGEQVKYLENRIKRNGGLYLHIIRNVSDYVLAEKQIMFMNERDTLTGLYQRNKFRKFYDKYSMSTDVIGLVIIDMNGLKLINETLGFTDGDNYLKILSANCLQYCPENGSVFRAGDDEIAFMVPDANNDELEEIVLNLNKQIELLNLTCFVKFPMSISAGVYIQHELSKGFETMFAQAEKNLNQNKLLHSESKKSSIVRTLAKALEARDFITEGHADRLEDMLESFAIAKNFESSTVTKMRLFGKFHDIGKVGISDTILFKPGKLTDHEYEEMKKHSEIGYKIAISSADLHIIADFILKHHERHDGKGYPIGLKGDEIPIECRILTIVDAYDAMTNNRPYRRAMSKELAIEELRRCSGGQFDPELVEFFIDRILN